MTINDILQKHGITNWKSEDNLDWQACHYPAPPGRTNVAARLSANNRDLQIWASVGAISKVHLRRKPEEPAFTYTEANAVLADFLGLPPELEKLLFDHGISPWGGHRPMRLRRADSSLAATLYADGTGCINVDPRDPLQEVKAKTKIEVDLALLEALQNNGSPKNGLTKWHEISSRTWRRYLASGGAPTKKILELCNKEVRIFDENGTLVAVFSDKKYTMPEADELYAKHLASTPVKSSGAKEELEKLLGTKWKDNQLYHGLANIYGANTSILEYPNGPYRLTEENLSKNSLEMISQFILDDIKVEKIHVRNLQKDQSQTFSQYGLSWRVLEWDSEDCECFGPSDNPNQSLIIIYPNGNFSIWNRTCENSYDSLKCLLDSELETSDGRTETSALLRLFFDLDLVVLDKPTTSNPATIQNTKKELPMASSNVVSTLSTPTLADNFTDLTSNIQEGILQGIADRNNEAVARKLLEKFAPDQKENPMVIVAMKLIIPSLMVAASSQIPHLATHQDRINAVARYAQVGAAAGATKELVPSLIELYEMFVED